MSKGHDASDAVLVEGDVTDAADRGNGATAPDRWGRVIDAYGAEIAEERTTASLGPHEPPPLGPAATPTNSVQPDVDTKGRDHYSDTDAQQEDKGSIGTFILRDKIESGFVDEGVHKGLMIDPRPYADLLYDMAGSPRMAPAMLTYLAGPERKPKRVRQLIKALDAFRERDEKGFALVMARFDEDRPATERTYAHLAAEFGMSKTACYNCVIDFVTTCTDWADSQWAGELERSAQAAGSLDDDEGAEIRHFVAAACGVDEPDRAVSRIPDDETPVVIRTPLEQYRRLTLRRD